MKIDALTVAEYVRYLVSEDLDRTRGHIWMAREASKGCNPLGVFRDGQTLNDIIADLQRRADKDLAALDALDNEGMTL